MALELYKPEEATRTRGLIGVLLAALLGYGLFHLYEFLGGWNYWKDDLVGGALGPEFPISPRVILIAVMGILTASSIYLLCNHAKVVDFLIDTEKEMQNVSWAPKHEVISSSIVVVITVLIMAAYLGVVDYGLVWAKDQVAWDALWDRVLGS
ncbi:MAG: preprotein translocase subunit SecE [Planctomycetota bacterium]|nr:preprotein translocase subunit SecE [Planctomycetota bacterium]